MGGPGSGRKRGGDKVSSMPEYKVWRAMIDRCYNPNTIGYISAGAKGAKVCEKWRNSFEMFMADLGPRPEKGSVLVREGNEGDFEPGRVWWGHRKEVQQFRKNSPNG